MCPSNEIQISQSTKKNWKQKLTLEQNNTWHETCSPLWHFHQLFATIRDFLVPLKSGFSFTGFLCSVLCNSLFFYQFLLNASQLCTFNWKIFKLLFFERLPGFFTYWLWYSWADENGIKVLLCRGVFNWKSAQHWGFKI